MEEDTWVQNLLYPMNRGQVFGHGLRTVCLKAYVRYLCVRLGFLRLDAFQLSGGGCNSGAKPGVCHTGREVQCVSAGIQNRRECVGVVCSGALTCARAGA